MKWRKACPEDSKAIIQLSREPMGGRVRLAWGLEKFEAPPECSNFAAYTVKEGELVQGMACSWHWPDANRYLSGLRFASRFHQRPRPMFWKQAYQDMLADVSHAWTCIGKENTRARRILESKSSWLPHYRARQEIRTWFVPFTRAKANAPKAIHDASLDLKAAAWRYVAIESGTGLTYQAGRLFHQLGCPGLPPSGQRMRVAYFRPNPNQNPKELRSAFSEIKGYDGVIIVLPKDSDSAKHWEANRPRLSWTWDSTLYAVSWDASTLNAPLPKWKGIWL